MDYERIISRASFIGLGYIITMALLVGCNNSANPKNQKNDGTCTANFLDSYNKISNSKFQPADAQTDDIKKTCESFLKTYGNTPEDCTAFAISDASPTNLNVKDVRETCSKKIQNNYY